MNQKTCVKDYKMYSWVRGEGSQVLQRMKTISSGMDTNPQVQPRDESKVTEELNGGETVLQYSRQVLRKHGNTHLPVQRTPENYSERNQSAGEEELQDEQDAIDSRTSMNQAAVKEGLSGYCRSASHASLPSSNVSGDDNRAPDNSNYNSKSSNETLQNERPQAAVEDAADTDDVAGVVRGGAWKRGGVRLNNSSAIHLQRMATMTSRHSRMSAPLSFLRADEPPRVPERSPRHTEATRSRATLRRRSGSIWSSALSAMGINSRRRQQLVSWSEGIRPQLVFASYADEGDGTNAKLTPTLLPRICAQHRCWETVSGRAFVVRLVGSFMANEAPTTIFASANGRTLRHTRRGRGWRAPTGARELVRARGGELSLCAGTTGKGAESAQLSAEMVWRADDGSGGAGTAGATLRFGFYFVVRGAGSLRLFASTATPERVRLVAVRGDGSVHQDATRAVSYVVLHVAAQ